MKEKLTANILFSGIGCQERGIENSGVFDLDVVTTSDIDKDAIVSYAAVHCGLTTEMVEEYDNYPTREQMAQELTDKNIGYDPQKDKKYNWFNLVKRNNKALNTFWLACKLSKNRGDISKIDVLPYADLWTISFCCQDISVAGKMKGFKPDSGTRSSLLWTNISLLKKSIDKGECPKFLMFENVKNLVSSKFINDFNSLLEVLDNLGFDSYWKILDGKECGVPQSRGRVFVVSIRKDIDTGTFEFPKPFDNGMRLSDILEHHVEDKYYLSEMVQSRFQFTDPTMEKNIIGTTKPDFRTIGQRDLVYKSDSIMGALMASDYKQPKQVLLPTGKIRKLTPMECWELMGWSRIDFIKAYNMGTSDTNLYKQAGNGIITNCVELIAEHLHKAQFDATFKCTDENFTQSQAD